MILANVIKYITLDSIKGSLLMAEKGNLATWVGLLVDPQAKILLVCDKDKAKDLI